jgi:hypothetical protein
MPSFPSYVRRVVAIVAFARAVLRRRRELSEHDTISADSIFDQAEIELARVLEPQGFRTSEPPPLPDGFVGQVLTYRRGGHAVRLVWDQREGRFSLQQSTSVAGEPAWVDLVSERSDPRADPARRADEITAALGQAIRRLRVSPTKGTA